ncbi:MAG: hypothetical protein JXA44_02015 [Methanospirillaceae archaeon]|nr:hypothetical protein [Methanospirillaceae archaeon]
MTGNCLIGVDIGGTNTDIVIINDDIHTQKLPTVPSLDPILSGMKKTGRLAVSTSCLLNQFLIGKRKTVACITIPGPGLTADHAVCGAIGHRGDILKDINPTEVEDYIRTHPADSLAVTGKFSVRNPCLEEKVVAIARKYYTDSCIAPSHTLGYLNMPERIRTTKANAALKEEVAVLIRQVEKYHSHFYFVSGNAGLVSKTRACENPLSLFHSSPATAALGSYYQIRRNGLVIDIGGSTTDLVPIADGLPVNGPLLLSGKKTGMDAVVCESIPYGGDSRVSPVLMPEREGNARAFGGKNPALTDALNVTGIAAIGNTDFPGLSREAAETALQTYLECVCSRLKNSIQGPLIGAGYLAPYLVPLIAKESRRRYYIPEHASSSNAIGAAVSRISLSLHVHLDTGKEILLYNGIPQPFPHDTDDESIISIAKEELQRRAAREGASQEDCRQVITEQFSAFDVITYYSADARILDCVLQIPPGISSEAP